MIPSVLSGEIRRSIEDFLRARYRITTPLFRDVVEEFIESGNAFKGPYLSFQLPFRKGLGGADYFPEVPMPFAPHLHQEQAFDRLSGSPPKPTIVATGTGSGKTESFLYPILDYCRQHADLPGIKAILIYPMNALANDQAGRIARTIHDNEILKGRVTAGLYIGGEGRSLQGVMTRDSIITNRYTMQDKPPDILVTNYKMLDYMLIRPKDARIWRRNGPDVLRFIVVDELHTFDGAQGTDLACLLRRLKLRLRAMDACPIATSATLGTGEGAKKEICSYAESIFSVPFDEDAVIAESRLSARDFFEDTLVTRFGVPDNLDRLDAAQYGTRPDYLAAQHAAWFGNTPSDEQLQDSTWRGALGERLMQHGAFQNLVKLVGSEIHPIGDVVGPLLDTQHGAQVSAEQADQIVESLLALVSLARNPNLPALPLLNVRVQMWLRELRRVVLSVSKEPKLAWDADLPAGRQRKYLPLVVCNNCGASAWLGLAEIGATRLRAGLKEIFKAYFEGKGSAKLVYPVEDTGQESAMPRQLCTKCLTINSQGKKECRDCGKPNDLIVVDIPDLEQTKGKRRRTCTYCGVRGSIGILGAQAASLTSVALGQLFGSRHNTDKKVLTFSDSVQDASHRAGFFQARTYSFSVRTALLQYLRQFEGTIDLKTLARGFVESTRRDLGDIQFVGTFIAPDLSLGDDYEHLVQNGVLSDTSQLPWIVEKRLTWDVTQSFGLLARRGRTLENTLTAAVGPDRGMLDAFVHDALTELRNEHEGLRNLDKNRLRRFLIGLVYRLRVSGGIQLPELDKYIKEGAKNPRARSKRTFLYMPRWGRRSWRPRFLSSKRMGEHMPIQGSRHNSWVQDWAARTLFSEEDTLLFVDVAVRDVLTSDGIGGLFERTVVGKESVWGVLPEALQVTTEAAAAACQVCRYQVSIPANDQEVWDSMPCLRFRCKGRFKVLDSQVDDYYARLYGSSDVVRFVAREHTGLLDRDEREELEKDFTRKDRRPWDPNIISCTPTMELGIDIGDLSTAVLCSVPPASANYLQRIGRAGRLDGNALNLTLAQNSWHDLYFFETPMSMMAESVAVPGVYLNAPAVLKRQLAAFTMDAWVASSDRPRSIPHRLGEVLNALGAEDSKRFPNSWLGYVESRHDQLLKSFLNLFENDDLSDMCKEVLRAYLSAGQDGSSLVRTDVHASLERKAREFLELRNSVKQVRGAIKTLDSRPHDKNYHDDLKDLNEDIRALKGLQRKIAATNIFNFLTDEGVLPNYAFPQGMVTLTSTIIDDEGRDSTFEYRRGGQMAIREFAPFNHFYANGRRVKPTTIDVKQSEIQRWRFCPNCSWCTLEAKAAKGRCPQCGAEGWGDLGQVFNMSRLVQVSSVSKDRASRTFDESETRERKYYIVRTHVHFKKNVEATTFVSRDKDAPFGFTYLREATFRTVNFGEPSAQAVPADIANDRVESGGFLCCPKCGRVSGSKQEDRMHEFSCTVKDKDAPLETEVFLYHEFKSEAVQFLVPELTDGGKSKQLDSFCAALIMGLRDHHRGRVDHLRITVQDEPYKKPPFRKQYVYLYDTVPGGTGYLKDLLASPKNLLDVLRKALKHLEECRCNDDETKDGCYNCLYAYRNSWDREWISRRVAVRLLRTILGADSSLESCSSLGTIDLGPLEESVLERKFLECLAQEARKQQGWEMSLDPRFFDKTPFELRVGKLNWQITPEESVGPKNGVAIPSRPDFVFRLTNDHHALPIAVFLDGAQFHLAKLDEDTAKRMALLASGRYRVWALTWNDLEVQNELHYTDLMPISAKRPLAKANFMRFAEGQEERIGSLKEQLRVRSADSYRMFLTLLANPGVAQWEALAYCHAASNLSPPFPNWDEITEWRAPGWYLELLPDAPQSLAGQYKFQEVGGRHEASVMVRTTEEGVRTHDVSKMQVVIHIDDSEHGDPKFKPVWNGFLRTMNLLQYLRHAGFFCSSGVEGNKYDEMYKQLTRAKVAIMEAEEA